MTAYFGRTRTQAVALVATASLLMALLHPLLLGARPELVGRPIQKVEFVGLETLSEESMRFYLDLEEAKPYDPAELNRRIKELWNREFLDDIQVDVEGVDDGVKVTVAVRERPVLLSIDYQGLKKVNRGDIGDHLDKERISLYENLPLDLGELARLKSSIKELYADRGYRFADVNVEVQEVSAAERRVVVTIDEGNKVKIGKVSFEGNDVFSSGKLRDRMKKTKKSSLLTRMRKRDVYNPATLEEDLENIRSLYHDHGYKNVRLGEPEVIVVEKRPNAETGEKKKRRLELVIPIDEGERWRLGDIFIEGNEVLGDEILKRVFEEPKGGWLRQSVIDEGIEKIREFYENTGYIFARVQPDLEERDDLVADLIVKIDESDQYRVGRVEFAGNTRTQDRVLRRQLRLHEGMVFNSGALKNSLFRINQLEFFRLNEEDPVEVEHDSDTKQVNLVVKGQEAERTEVQFGGGFSEVEGFFAQAAVRTRNFLGRGETLGLSLQSGKFRQQFDVSYFVPWLLDRPQNVGVQIFKSELDFDFTSGSGLSRVLSNQQGARLSYGRSFGLFSNVSLSYGNQEIENFESLPLGDDIISREGRLDRSSITLGYVYDSHDSRLEPTIGKRMRANVEYAGGFLGGDSLFVRPSLNLAYTRPLLRKGMRTVGRVNFEIGQVFPFGDSAASDRPLSVFDQYFLGGENTIRGFRVRQIVVRDPETGAFIPDADGFVQGGDKFLQLNLEHHFLVNGPFRVVLFADAGNVYGPEQDFDLSHLRSSAGIELRINVPLFGAPLRFIYAQNLDPFDLQPDQLQEEFETFDFSIGTSF